MSHFVFGTQMFQISRIFRFKQFVTWENDEIPRDSFVCMLRHRSQTNMNQNSILTRINCIILYVLGNYD